LHRPYKFVGANYFLSLHTKSEFGVCWSVGLNGLARNLPGWHGDHRIKPPAASAQGHREDYFVKNLIGIDPPAGFNIGRPRATSTSQADGSR
jgi:hypothetical protein